MKRTTISLSEEVYATGIRRQKETKKKSFTEYVSMLIEVDGRENPKYVTVREEPPETGFEKRENHEDGKRG